MKTFEELVQEKVDAGLTLVQAESVVSRSFPKLKKADAAHDPERIKEKTDAGLTVEQAESVIGREKQSAETKPVKAKTKTAQA